VSPLKIKITSENMREKPTNATIIHSVYLLCMVVPTCFGITLLQGMFLVPSERFSIEEQLTEYCGWACCV
jgi:glycopeptide antibiotics resistance protein